MPVVLTEDRPVSWLVRFKRKDHRVERTCGRINNFSRYDTKSCWQEARSWLLFWRTYSLFASWGTASFVSKIWSKYAQPCMSLPVDFLKVKIFEVESVKLDTEITMVLIDSNQVSFVNMPLCLLLPSG